MGFLICPPGLNFPIQLSPKKTGFSSLKNSQISDPENLNKSELITMVSHAAMMTTIHKNKYKNKLKHVKDKVA